MSNQSTTETTDAGGYAYARDTRYDRRILRFQNSTARDKYAEAEHQNMCYINDEEDAYMLALGYELDEDFVVWQSADDMMHGIGEGIDANDADAVQAVIDGRDKRGDDCLFVDVEVGFDD